MKGIFSRKAKLRKTPEGKLSCILEDFAISVVLDVGANFGQTHDRLREARYRGRIVSFEPVPRAHAELTAKARNDPNWVVAPRCAIGEASGETSINVSRSTDMSSILEPKEVLLQTLPGTEIQERVLTPVSTIDAEWDAHCSQTDRVFLKVDTQGFERQVLNGAQDHLGEILGIQLELSLLPLYEGEELYLSYLNDLEAWGFEPFMIWETYFSRMHGRQLQIDVVYMRSEHKASGS